jgi:HEAT repeat protein
MAAAILASLVLPCRAQTVPAASEMDRLIEVLKSDADYAAKATACRQLSFIGTEKAVAPLAALLADEKLSDMARYGLEPMPYTAVDDAFLAALGQAGGMPLVGVIDSIGVRGDARAVVPLSKLLTAADADAAEAAARALGSIGTAEAGNAIKARLAAAPAARRWAFYEGMLRCAEKLAAAEQAEAAIAIYDVLRVSEAPHHVRAGGVRGAILARQGRQRGQLLREYMGSDDYVIFAAAVQTTHQLAGERITAALTAALPDVPADNQILILHALGERNDATALEAVYAVAKSADKRVRIAAIQALPDIADAPAPALVDLMFDADGDIAGAAQESFAAMGGAQADAAVLEMLASADTARQLKALDLIGRRRMTAVTDALLNACRDDDESVRSASIALLGDLADASRFPMLVELLLKASGSSEIRAAERAISSACTRQARLGSGNVVIHKAVYAAVEGKGRANVTKKVAQMVESGSASITASNANFGEPAPNVVKQLQIEYSVDGAAQSVTVREGETLTLAVAVVPEAFIDQLCSAAAKASGEQKAALLRVLKTTGAPRGLQAIVAAAKDADRQVADEAVSLLCGWPTPDALPEVLKLTESADAKTRILALRGAIRLIPLQNASDADKLSAFKAISPRVQRVEEKRLLLGALGQVATADALAMATPYLDDAGTKGEASLAVVTIAEALLKGPDAGKHAGALVAALEKAARADSAELAQRAKGLLAEAKKAGER